MRKLLLALMLILFTTQAHAFGWFLLGVAVGESSNSGDTTVIKPSYSGKFLEMYKGDCWAVKRHKKYINSKVLVNSGYIMNIGQPHGEYGDKKTCTNVTLSTGSNGHIKESYDNVIKKLFKAKK